MKLRIRGDSVRLRLTQSEVKQAQQGQVVEERTHLLGPQPLVYSFEPTERLEQIEARLIENRIRILVPTQLAKDWAASHQVAIKNDPNSKLFILIEKDFMCLKPRLNENEDESDLFTNPNEAHGTCS